MNKWQRKRRRMIWRWKNAHLSYCSNSTSVTLAAQEAATKRIADYCDTQDITGKGAHYHMCTFAMLSNDQNWQNAKCNEWRKQHSIQVPKNYSYKFREDYCDYCPMMNYVALDDEGKIMYVHRTFPEDRQISSYESLLAAEKT